MKNLILIGLSGCGKTTLGQMCAKEYNLSFFDTDNEIAKEAGMSVADFFEKFGETVFRRAEEDIIGKLAKEKSAVISTGGGAVKDAENTRLLRESGLIVYLKAPPAKIAENLANDDTRPLLAGQDKLTALETLLRERGKLYGSCADVIADVNCGVDEAFERLNLLIGKNFKRGN